MLTHNDLKKGARFILDEQPYEVLESQPLKVAQGKAVIQTKVRDLITGSVFVKNFHQGDTFEETELEKIEAKFIYQHKGKFVFSESKNSSNRLPERGEAERKVGSLNFVHLTPRASLGQMKANSEGGKLHRFELTEEQIGSGAKFLKPNQELTAIKFKEKIVNIVLPIKVQLKVTESPPGLKGGRAQAGNKTVTLESGAQINVPLFIEQDDIIELNTENGEYVRRVE